MGLWSFSLEKGALKINWDFPDYSGHPVYVRPFVIIRTKRKKQELYLVEATVVTLQKAG